LYQELLNSQKTLKITVYADAASITWTYFLGPKWLCHWKALSVFEILPYVNHLCHSVTE